MTAVYIEANSHIPSKDRKIECMGQPCLFQTDLLERIREAILLHPSITVHPWGPPTMATSRLLFM